MINTKAEWTADSIATTVEKYLKRTRCTKLGTGFWVHTHAYAHTHTHIYTYIFIRLICVCRSNARTSSNYSSLQMTPTNYHHHHHHHHHHRQQQQQQLFLCFHLRPMNLHSSVFLTNQQSSTSTVFPSMSISLTVSKQVSGSTTPSSTSSLDIFFTIIIELRRCSCSTLSCGPNYQTSKRILI
jgi:hypothetical protein